jgi:hypothetical protein
MNLNEVQLGYIAHLAAVGLLHAALLIPPSILSHTKLALAFLPPIWGCHVYSWSVGLGFLAAIQVLWATELLLFRYPREKFQVIHRRELGSTSPNPKGDDFTERRRERERQEEGTKPDLERALPHQLLETLLVGIQTGCLDALCRMGYWGYEDNRSEETAILRFVAAWEYSLRGNLFLLGRRHEFLPAF